MAKKLVFLLTTLMVLATHTLVLMLLLGFVGVQLVNQATLAVAGERPGLEALGAFFGGAILGFFLSLPLLFVPYKLLMKLAVYLREKRGWTELTHPRKIFVWALITFYGPLILLYYFFKYAS